MKLSKTVKFLQESSDHDWDIASSLLKSKKYDACLFFCHLTLEKLLKGLATAKNNEIFPHSHDLVKLARLAGVKINEKQKEELEIITSFNISARYDNVKREFYKRCTKEYAEKYFNLTKRWLALVKKNYPKK